MPEPAAFHMDPLIICILAKFTKADIDSCAEKVIVNAIFQITILYCRNFSLTHQYRPCQNPTNQEI